MTTAVKTFILILAILVLGGVGVWFGWRAYTWPKITLSNGWTMHIAKAWYRVDVSEVPEISRPLLFIQSSQQQTENRLTVNERPYPAKDLATFVKEQHLQFAVEKKDAKILGQGYFQEKEKTLPYVYQHADGLYTLSMMATKNNRTYYFEARYSDAVSDSFGAQVINSFRSLR
jgi:hypothetical protein